MKASYPASWYLSVDSNEYPGWSVPLVILGNLNGAWSIVLTISSKTELIISSFNGDVVAINFVSTILGREDLTNS